MDVQPSRGPKETVSITGDIIYNYFEENLTDVLKMSGLGSNFSAYLQPTVDNNLTTLPSKQPDMALEWYVPDGTNRQLVNILDKSIANFRSSGVGMVTMLVLLPQLHPFYGTDQFLVDLDTGKLFVLMKAQWRHSGLYCMNNPFELEKLWRSIEHNLAVMKSDMETEEQIAVVRTRQETQRRGAQLPSLPLMGDPEIYVKYPDAMPPLTRKNYVRDRTQSALTYILEYRQTEAMLEEGIYEENEVQQRLRAVFGRVDAIRRRIDDALENDDMHRRRRNMRVLPLPKNFPEPQSMRQSPVPAWVRWIREESEKIISELEEEMKRRHDTDDPFDRKAGGTFETLEHDIRIPLIPLPKEKKSVQNKRKNEKLKISLSNKETPVQNKNVINPDEVEWTRGWNKRSFSPSNRIVSRQKGEQLIDHPSIGQPQQLKPVETPVMNSRRSDKSHSLLDQGTHLRPLQARTHHEEVHQYIPTYVIGERREDQLDERISNEKPVVGDSKAIHEVQRKSDYSQQSQLLSLLHASGMPQGQVTSEEEDPYRTVRELHMRQREFITQPDLSNTTFPMKGQKERYERKGNAFGQEPPKPQRERPEKKRTVQTSVRNTLIEPLEEISYIPRDSQLSRGQQFMRGHINQLDLTSYMQLPSGEQDGKICGKCGEQGHMKRQCTANVVCDFCKTRSHSTLACRTYANFVKEHPLTSSRKNTPEKLHNEFDVNIEIAKRVEMELRKWQREQEPKGKPLMPQLRKQQMMNFQKLPTQEMPYSQDIRVQMGE